MPGTLGERIREQRERRNLGQAQLAKLAKVGLSTLMRYEAGERGTKAPQLKTVERVARALGVRVEYLQHGTGDVEDAPEARHARLDEHPTWKATAIAAKDVAPELARWIDEAGTMRVGRSGTPRHVDVRGVLDLAGVLQRLHAQT